MDINDEGDDANNYIAAKTIEDDAVLAHPASALRSWIKRADIQNDHITAPGMVKYFFAQPLHFFSFVWCWHCIMVYLLYR